MPITRTTGRRGVCALAVALLVAVACGGSTNVTVPVEFAQTSYFDGRTTRQVLAVSNGRASGVVRDAADINLEDVKPETFVLGPKGQTKDIVGRVDSASAQQISFSFDFASSGLQDPNSTEPRQVELCVWFDAAGATFGEGCQTVLIPPARPAPQPLPEPAPSGGSSGPSSPSHGTVGWTNVTSTAGTAPERRVHHAMATLPNGDVLLFGGLVRVGASSPAINDETWIFNGTSWRNVTPTVRPADYPTPRSDAAMAFDGDEVVLFGGFGTAPGSSAPPDELDDTYVFNVTTETWSRVLVTGPSPRMAAAMGSENASGTLGTITGAVLFGGENNGTALGDTHRWDGATNTWSSPTFGVGAAVPPARTQAAMSFDPLSNTTVLHGGEDSAGAPLGDTWAWHAGPESWHDETDPSEPGTRTNAAAAALGDDGPMLHYGGYNGTSTTDATHFWDGTEFQSMTSSPPPARASHGMATLVDGSEERLVLFGGHDASGNFLAETWIYDPTP